MAEDTAIVLRLGDTLTLPLKSLGSAGYSWSYEVSGSSDAIEVAIRGTGAPPAAEGGRPPAASSAGEQVVLKAIQVGDVTVHLSLRRPWEIGKKPLAERVLEIHVQH